MSVENRDLIAEWIATTHRGSLEDLESPTFEDAKKVHDWRNHVGDAVKSIWDTLSLEQRAAIAIDAWVSASNEEWE